MVDYKRIALLMGTTGATSEPIAEGFVRFARTRTDWQVFMLNSSEPVELQRLGRHGASGVLSFVSSRPRAEELVDLPVPVVNTREAYLDVGLPTVTVSNRSVGRCAAEYFCRLGIRHLGYIGPDANVVDTLRLAGFREAADEAGLGISHLPVADLWNFAEHDEVMTRIGHWLAELPKPCGVMGFSDQYALGASQAAALAHIHVPEEVAIIGVDDNPVLCESSNPPLSSVDLSGQRVGFRAGQLLDELIRDAARPAGAILIEPRGVIARGSTETLGFEDRDVIRAVQYIRQHATDGIRVSDVLDHLSVSRSSLVSKFQRHLGRSPLDEIRRVRLDAVYRLLRETDWSLAEIGARTGFASIAHLSRVVKAATGLTPTQYRRQSGQGTEETPG